MYLVPRTRAWMSEEEVAAATDCLPAVNETLREDIRWIRSYVVSEDDGTFSGYCVYEASSPETLLRHAEAMRLPTDAIKPVFATIVAGPGPRARRHRLTPWVAPSERCWRERRAAVVGRDAELAALLALFEDEGPLVTVVHGVAGSGKVRAAARVRVAGGRARDRGRRRRPRDRADAPGLPRRRRPHTGPAGVRPRRRRGPGGPHGRHRRAHPAARRMAAPGVPAVAAGPTRASSWPRGTRRAPSGARRSAS